MSDHPFEKFDENPFADAAVVNASEFNESTAPQVASSSSSSSSRPVSTASSSKKSGGGAAGFFSGLGATAKKGFQSFQDEDDGPEQHSGPMEKDDAHLFQGSSSSSSPPPPAYSSPSASAGGYNPYDDNAGANHQQDEALRKKEAELRRKEEELNVKMRMQAEQQAQLQEQQRQQAVGQFKPPNWPPFPKFFPCKPWLYHNIPDEIPKEHQRHVRFLYWSWLLLLICYFVNIIATMTILIAQQGGKDFGFAIMYLPIITAASFYLWYRPVYNAYMKDKSFYFIMFLFFAGWNVAFELYIIIGLPDTGSCGFINMINLFGTGHIGNGVICLLGLLLWIFAVAVHIWQWRLVYRDFRFRGHTIAEARNQAFSSAARTAAQSEAGREAISSAVTGAVSGAMRGDQRA